MSGMNITVRPTSDESYLNILMMDDYYVSVVMYLLFLKPMTPRPGPIRSNTYLTASRFRIINVDDDHCIVMMTPRTE